MSARRGKETSYAGHHFGDSGASNRNIGGYQLSHDVENMTLDKFKNQTGGNAANQLAIQRSNRNARGKQNTWRQPNASQWANTREQPNVVTQKYGMERGEPSGLVSQRQTVDTRRTNDRTLNAPPHVVAPPLQNGWQWRARAESTPINLGRHSGEDYESDVVADHTDEDDGDMVEDDNDDMISYDSDSDESVKSHETRKNQKWFKTFFEDLDKLTTEELNEPSREWHCPACRNGPGGTEWFKGIQSVIKHAETKGANRVKLHRELAQILEEELSQRGVPLIAGEALGKWEGLHNTVSDREIVWPPMIVVMNTQLEMDEQENKWLGMGNQELLDYFSSYKPMKARHAYGPNGHRGISLLIFESSAMGRLDAERLHKHFVEQGTDRHAWENNRVLFYHGGKRQLYGYLACKQDMDNFNKHCQGKNKLKFEMKSYQEMVVGPMDQMKEDNQQLVYFKDKLTREQRFGKVLQESFDLVTQKLRKTNEENRIVRERTKMQHEQNKEEMDYQEKFYKSQIDVIKKALEKKEREFEARFKEEMDKQILIQSTADSGTREDAKLRLKEATETIESNIKGIEEFEAKREKLIKLHEDKKTEMKRRHLEEEVTLEKEFEGSLTMLMEQYAPHSSEEVST